jgi:hypothetical protein
MIHHATHSGQSGRPMNVGQLADFTANLSAAGIGATGLSPADVYILGSGTAVSRCSTTLRKGLEPFGLHIVLVTVADEVPVRLVSAHRPGPPAVWSEAEVNDLIEDVRAERLAHWAHCAAEAPQLRTLHRPGSDSIGVIEFDCPAGRLVAKVGPSEVMLAEQDLVRRAHDSNAAIFPVPRGYEARNGLAIRIMDAVDNAGLVERMFHAGPDGLLRASVGELPAVDEHLRALMAWYAETLVDGEPEVSRYLYVDRFRSLPRSEPYIAVADHVLGPGASRDAMEIAVSFPDGSQASYRELVSWVSLTYPEWQPTRSAAVHGDIFTSNLMRGPSGEARFIDPRSAWDGVVESRTGRGDPFFDLGTLLHALSPMVAILDAGARGIDSRLLPEGIFTPGHIDATAVPTVADTAIRGGYLRRIADLTSEWADTYAVMRVHVASACSLLGWLKYKKVVQNNNIWWAIFLAVIADLARARRVYNGLDPAFTSDSERGTP